MHRPEPPLLTKATFSPLSPSSHAQWEATAELLSDHPDDEKSRPDNSRQNRLESRVLMDLMVAVRGNEDPTDSRLVLP